MADAGCLATAASSAAARRPKVLLLPPLTPPPPPPLLLARRQPQAACRALLQARVDGRGRLTACLAAGRVVAELQLWLLAAIPWQSRYLETKLHSDCRPAASGAA